MRRALGWLLLVACAKDDADADPPSSTDTSASTTDDGAPESGATSFSSTSGRIDTSAGSSSSDGSTGTDPSVLPGCPEVRAETDLADDSSDPQVRVLYVIPSDSVDDELDLDGRICSSTLGWTQWLLDQTGGRRLRLDTSGDVLDIGFVRLEVTDAVMHGSSPEPDVETGFAYVRDRIERELLQMGMLAPHKIYAVYYGGTSEYSCGGGSYPPLIVDQVGAMYLGGQIPGFPACDEQPWGEADLVPRYIDYGMLHEIMHTLGLVDPLAPHEHASGHAFDDGEADPQRDLLYSQRAGMDDPDWGVYEPGGLLLDLGRDDYFEQPGATIVDLSRSVFLEPMPPDATFPPGWSRDAPPSPAIELRRPLFPPVTGAWAARSR
ncbi:MAG TPA: hypothetical protein VFG69_21240, partial [Nannocystaceae bacterium]|nr:hypothetical protein [Nannocystaceae bacterium]